MRRTCLLPVLLLVGCGGQRDAPVAATTAAASPAPPPPTATAAPRPPPPPAPDRPLLHPERATERAPERFKVRFATTKGDFTVETTRAWSPHGADRFYNLVKLGFYDGVRFHRAVDGFMVQFGVNGDPRVTHAWSRATIPDDKVVKSNTRGYVTFATAGPNTRSTQLFINYVDANRRLDGMGFSPFGLVVEGMAVVDKLHRGYGESRPRGNGPDPARLEREGEPYLAKDFPALDKIKTARIL